MKEFFKLEFDSNRTFGLDILRFFAILFVLLQHSNSYLPNNYSFFIHLFYSIDGVSLFFILSGFLIGGILIKIIEKERLTTKSLLQFWKRRWYRTLQNYFLILVVLITLELIFDKGVSLASVKSYFIFSQNIFQPHPLFFVEAWSLSIEEWFYFLIPCLLLLSLNILRLRNIKALFFVALIVILSITLFRYYRYRTIYIKDFWDWDYMFRAQVSTRLDSLMYGVCGAIVSFYYKEKWVTYKYLLFFIGLTILLFQSFVTIDSKLYLCVFSFSLTSIATLLLLPFLSSYVKGKGLLYRIITVFSLLSYSMYLINFTLVKDWIVAPIDLSSLATIGLYLNMLYFGL